MRITRKKLQQIVNEEKTKLREQWRDRSLHYAHTDIVTTLVEAIDPEWTDVNREQMRLALEDAMKQIGLDSGYESEQGSFSDIR